MHKRLAKPKETPDVVVSATPGVDQDDQIANNNNNSDSSLGVNKSQVTIWSIADAHLNKSELEKIEKRENRRDKEASKRTSGVSGRGENEYDEDEDGESHSSSNAPPPPKDPAQLILEQRLQSILNLIELGIIDPHEAPIILNTDPDDSDEGEDNLSPLQIFCIIFIVIAIVVLLVIGLVFVFGLIGSSGMNDSDDSSSSSNDYNPVVNCNNEVDFGQYYCEEGYRKWASTCDSCDRYLYRVKSYMPYIALIGVYYHNDQSKVENCVGALINKSAMIASASCFSAFFKSADINSSRAYLSNFKMSTLTAYGYSLRVLVNQTTSLSSLDTSFMKSLSVLDIAPFMYDHELDFESSSVIIYIQNSTMSGKNYFCLPGPFDYVPAPSSGIFYLKYFTQRLLSNGTLIVTDQSLSFQSNFTCRVTDAWNEFSSRYIVKSKQCNPKSVLNGSPYLYKDRNGVWKLLGNLANLANHSCDSSLSNY